MVGAKDDMNPRSHLKSTQQELKKSVVDGADGVARYFPSQETMAFAIPDSLLSGDSAKSTAQRMKERSINNTVEKG